MNKKKVILILSVIALLFSLSGCSIPVDESGKFILITADTTFKHMMSNEGFFSALFVYPLSKMINFIAPLTNVGIAIVLVTIIVNALALVLTLKSNVDMQKMQIAQPEIERITKKYEGKTDEASKMRQAQETQRIYQKYNINIFSTMLAQFIQFPILIAMYHAVQRSEAVATGSFLGMNLDISPLAGVQNGQYGYIVIFVLMLIAQFISMRTPVMLQKIRAKKEAEMHYKRYQEPKNPMGNSMYFMIIFIGVLMLQWPSAMSLYYFISSCVMIIKTIIVDKIAMKEKEKL